MLYVSQQQTTNVYVHAHATCSLLFGGTLFEVSMMQRVVTYISAVQGLGIKVSSSGQSRKIGLPFSIYVCQCLQNICKGWNVFCFGICS